MVEVEEKATLIKKKMKAITKKWEDANKTNVFIFTDGYSMFTYRRLVKFLTKLDRKEEKQNSSNKKGKKRDKNKGKKKKLGKRPHVSLLLDSYGGSSEVCDLVIRHLRHRPVTVFISCRAASSATATALALDTVIMSPYAYLTPFDGLFAGLPVMNIAEMSLEKITRPKFYNQVVEARKSVKWMQDTVEKLIGERYSPQVQKKVDAQMNFHQRYHEYPITGQELIDLGLTHITVKPLPKKIQKLFWLQVKLDNLD